MNWSSLITIIIFSLTVIYIINYLRVIFTEMKIKKLYKKMEIEIGNVKGPGLQSVIEGRMNMVRNKYIPEIEKLERHRRYILEKLPLIKN